MKALLLATLFFSAVIACGGSTPPPQTGASTPAAGAMPPTCKEIHEACEPFENKGGAGQTCHEMGHGTGVTEEACAAKKAECMAACAKK
jgi:hypothetical protein